MELRTRTSGGVWLLELEGNLTIGNGDLVLRKAVGELLEEGRSRLVLDLGGVRYVDSAGIGEILACKKRARDAGGDVRLLKPRKRVHEALVMSRVSEVFQIFTDEAQALEEGKDWPGTKKG